MYNMIEKYIEKLKLDDLDAIFKKNNLNLSSEELNFSFHFLKKNWQTYLTNPSSFNIDKYKNYYSSENFFKIKELYAQYFSKFARFL